MKVVLINCIHTEILDKKKINRLHPADIYVAGWIKADA